LKSKVLGYYDGLYKKAKKIQKLKNEIEEAEVTGKVVQRRFNGLTWLCCAK
jgi:hypothetical protein